MSYDTMIDIARYPQLKGGDPLDNVYREICLSQKELPEWAAEFAVKEQNAQELVAALVADKRRIREANAPQPQRRSVKDRLSVALHRRKFCRLMREAYADRIRAVETLYLNNPRATIKLFLSSPEPKIREYGIRLIGVLGLDNSPAVTV